MLDGPVEPWQPPSMFGAITNQRSVSIAAPGPTRSSHQPVGGVPRPGGASHVAVTGEGMQDQDGVVARGRELAPRLVREAVTRKLLPALGAERAERGEVPIADRITVAPRARGGRAAQQQARIGLRDRRAGHRVFGGLPVHGSILAGIDGAGRCITPVGVGEYGARHGCDRVPPRFRPVDPVAGPA